MLAHLAVRQQVAVGEGAGPTAPGFSGRARLTQLPRGHERSRARAPGCHRLPLTSPTPRYRGRSRLWDPQFLHLRGKVHVLNFKIIIFRALLRAFLTADGLRGNRGSRVFIFCSFSLLFPAARGEEGANVVLRLLFRLEKRAKAS